MKLVLEIAPHGGDDAPRHHRVEKFPAHFGRGYDNDVILSDAGVDARHFRIEVDASGNAGGGKNWIITDLGSLNPTLLNGKALRSGSAPLSSGDTVRAGGVKLRVFSPEHPVPAPVRIQRESPVIKKIGRPVAAWGLFVLALGAVVGTTYATVWSEETALALASAAAGAGIVAFIWSGLWSVAGRLSRRRAHFTAHIAMFSAYLILSLVAAWAALVLEYLLSENLAAAAVSYAISAALFALFLYGSLSASTQMQRRRSVSAAVFVTLGIVLAVGGLEAVQKGKFSADPGYSSTLLPYVGKIAPARDIDGFIGRAEKVFDSGTFKLKDKDGKEKKAEAKTVAPAAKPAPAPDAKSEPAPQPDFEATPPE